MWRFGRRTWVFLALPLALIANALLSCSSDGANTGEDESDSGDADTSLISDAIYDATTLDAIEPVDASDGGDAGKIAYAAHGNISVDGVANESVWNTAPFADWDTDYAGNATGVFTHVKFAWSDKGLAIFASVDDAKLNVDKTQPTNVDRQKLYQEDCVELFFTPKPATPNRYYEIELGPYGHFLDLAVDLDKKTYDTAWSSGLTVATKVDPSAKHASIEALFTASDIAGVLAGGASYRIGLFRNEGKTTDPGGRLALAWSPAFTKTANFHVPSAFGTLVLLP